MISLKQKLLFSYGLLILIIAASSFWSVYHLVLTLALAVVFSWRFTHYIVDPISELADKARLIGKGDFDQRIGVASKDEIGELAVEFNRMLARLSDLRRSDYGKLLIEQRKSDAAIDSLYEPVIVTDAQGQVVKLNRAARHLFGEALSNRGDRLTPASLGGERMLQAIKDAISMQRPVAAEGSEAIVPIKVGGADRSFRLRATPMRDDEGRLVGAVTLLEDITALAEVDKLKTEFISVASNKLGEPLQALQLALHAVIEGYMGELSEQQQEALESARDNAHKLEEILGDLLELTEIESGARRLTTERLRPIDLAREAVERFRAAAETKDIKLENNVWPDLPWVVADRNAMARIFDNLLSNAIRHTERGGRVSIEAGESNSRVLFSVSDTGPGIPEDQLPLLFRRFVKIGDKPGGAGLGLALTKRLVEAQGGQISVQSHVGEGSTFTFALSEGGPSSVRSLGSARVY
ncbi:MAG TPA: ATP-binding protein [Blastocatellia bacterium]|jgi:PAS domain S-box-containing protein